MEPKQQKSHDGGFLTFLEESKRLEQVQRGERTDPLRLLGALTESGPLTVAELMVKSGMSFDQFAATLKTMQETGLVSLNGKSGQEVVEITQNGAQLAQLAR